MQASTSGVSRLALLVIPSRPTGTARSSSSLMCQRARHPHPSDLASPRGGPLPSHSEASLSAVLPEIRRKVDPGVVRAPHHEHVAARCLMPLAPLLPHSV